jgi:hypothetical protein
LRDHSILGATIDTLLLGAVIYLSYKAVDQRNQEELDHKIAVASRAGGVSSHLATGHLQHPGLGSVSPLNNALGAAR